MITPKNVWPTVLKVLIILLCLNKFHFVLTGCSSSEWECDNGQCILDHKLCNGRVDCGDRSDEIAENCIHLHDSCQEYAFRCIYGACIDGSAQCNGTQECADNSDELICKQKTDADFQGTCPRNQMQCLTSKECIKLTLLCDGMPNCRDGSDEALEVCVNYACNGYGFQCGSGACISEDARCNGKIECVDGSDEAWELCSTPRKKNNLISVVPTSRPTQGPTPKPTPMPTPTPTLTQKPDPTTPTKISGCFLPNFDFLQNLIIKLHPQNQTIELGTFVEAFETVHFECKTGGKLTGESSLLCTGDEFNHDFPTCAKFCDGNLLNRLSLRAICDYGDKFVVCPAQISAGTDIQIKCAYGYSRVPNTAQYLKCLPSGNFDKIVKRCDTMKCGRIASAAAHLSKDGIDIDISKAPWHVAIFEDHRAYYNYICGGSIVSPSIVISAAHCFWDEANQVQKNLTKYQIIAGRNTSIYSDEQTNHSQVVKVLEVHIPQKYGGRDLQHKEDIAFLKLERPLKFSKNIAPVCLPQDLQNSARRYVMSDQPGSISGFGVLNQLERVNMKTLAYHDCVAKPVEAQIADDKFCAYTIDNAFVCRGDSGGGFLLGDIDSDTGLMRYHLWGVISNTPSTTNDCARTGGQAYIAITNIFHTRASFQIDLARARELDETLF